MIRLYAEGKKYQALCQELKDAKSILNNCSHALKKEKTDFRKLSYLNAKTEVKEIIDEIAELKIQICCSNEFESLNDIDKKIYELYFLKTKVMDKLKLNVTLVTVTSAESYVVYVFVIFVIFMKLMVVKLQSSITIIVKTKIVQHFLL